MVDKREDAALVEDHLNEVRNDDKYEWMPVAKMRWKLLLVISISFS